MRINLLNSRGIHAREVTGIDSLRTRLPSEWFGFANLEMLQRADRPRQIDVVLVIDDRILIADLKDWRGAIKSDGQTWYQNGRVMEPSPALKIVDNARIMAGELRAFVRASASRNAVAGDQAAVREPFVQGRVILTNKCHIEEMPEEERQYVVTMDDLCRALTVSDKRERYRLLGEPTRLPRPFPLTDKEGFWKNKLEAFFRAKERFRPQELLYADHRVCSDATFVHADGLYDEFDVEEVGGGKSPGLLRRWDFSKAPTRFAAEEARGEIAGREQRVIAFLTERAPNLEAALLRAKARDRENTVRYWEIFEKRRPLRRLREFLRANGDQLPQRAREDLIRSLLNHVATMHRLGVAHCDLGFHSIWLELPTSVRLSHLLAAHYPELRTLGQERFSFLAGDTVLPETHLGITATPFQKDVFLLGVASHELAFGVQPHRNTPEDAPSWKPEVDGDGRFRHLRGWFEKALALEAGQRFADGQEMLDAFNEATGARPVSAEALERLERFRKWPSIMALFREYPSTHTLREEGSLGAYRSDRSGESFLVKYWSASHAGDLRTEATRLLAFFDKADHLACREIVGVCGPVQAGFAGDNVVLVQRFIAAPNLTEECTAAPLRWRQPELVLHFALALCETVGRLHDNGSAHGDISPTNILVVREDGGAASPVLVDILDLAAAGDGELRTPAYAPPYAAEAAERDRYSVLQVVDELLAACDLAEACADRLRAAMDVCRSGPPPLASLSPLVEAIGQILAPSAEETMLRLRAVLPRQAPQTLLPDDGHYHVVLEPPRGRGPRILVAGANAELVVELDRARGLVCSASVRALPQSEVAWRQRKAETTFAGVVEVADGAARDFTGLDPLLELPEIRAALSRASEAKAPVTDLLAQDDGLSGSAGDRSVVREDLEAGTADAEPVPQLDVSGLWRTLLEVEAEQFTTVMTDDESSFSKKLKRHLVGYALTAGTIDYDPDEPVQVEIRTKSGDWRRIGRLDLDQTNSDALAIDASATWAADRGQLLTEPSELRLIGLREADSRNRRQLAIDLILERKSGVPNLVEYFSLDTDVSSLSFYAEKPAPANPEEIAARYNLNSSQASALADLWASRPLGLLQGPPGTGKTTFIAAMVHHALTTGAVRNVLLASQSHEAVNNAGEAILRLFRRFGGDPNLIRVGQEGNVSEALLPFHSARVEARYRDQFRARLREKLLELGRRLGAPEAFLDDFFFLEATVHPILRRIAETVAEEGDAITAEAQEGRSAELVETVRQLMDQHGLPALPAPELAKPGAFDRLVYMLAEATPGTSREQVRRALNLAELCRDWLNSVSNRRRNFESFLVGTRQIVCGTCVGLGRSSVAPLPGSFDLVVIDEAARCTASELAIPMQAGRWVVLVGDHMQLEPHYELPVLNETARRLAIPEGTIRQSDFERAFGSPYGAVAGRDLRVQYRMLPAIGRLVSHSFYGGRLEHGRSEPVVPPGALPSGFEAPILWFDTSGRSAAAFQSSAGKGQRSLCNETEAEAVADLLRRLDQHPPFHEWLRQRRDEHQAIGVICMYSAQRDLVRRKMVLASLTPAMRQACKVETVDSYQGKENDIVVLSLVRNNDWGPDEGGGRTIKEGFMARANRINVALSRARDRLVIVGSLHRWPEGGPMARVADFVQTLADEGEASIVENV
ncbi:AAA domain-containing protein [Roseomonas sp. GC11]|uniref:AAA domain-containing protein n=1 Tax=Roseomonas sp. GC11 TaxID=2950546 RepID=UPI0021093337|nr:AAA domain-containing protein [Roseomonas sp. GC11]MCQ4161269.1 AAA domain-containing protein [Roseomonas sp. GC11]